MSGWHATLALSRVRLRGSQSATSDAIAEAAMTVVFDPHSNERTLNECFF